MKCRCGGKAAQVCACGREHCTVHQQQPPQVVHCAECQQPLCFWHFSQRPDVGGVTRLVCHPSCEHALTGSGYLDYLDAMKAVAP